MGWEGVSIRFSESQLSTLQADLTPTCADEAQVQLFFTLRLVLGSCCAACEAVFVTGIRKKFGTGVAWLTIVLMATCTGMFHASVGTLRCDFDRTVC